MSTLSLRKIKHDSSAVDNITLGSTGRVSIKSPGADGLVLETDTADSTCSTRIFAKNNTYTGGMYYDDTGWNITTGSSIGSASGSPKLNITREGYIKTPNQPAFYVTEAELTAEAARLDAEYIANQYQRDRAAAYPSFADQFDTLYHGGIDAWKATIDTVKEQFPKP
jgi:hypothetical protein